VNQIGFAYEGPTGRHQVADAPVDHILHHAPRTQPPHEDYRKVHSLFDGPGLRREVGFSLWLVDTLGRWLGVLPRTSARDLDGVNARFGKGLRRRHRLLQSQAVISPINAAKLAQDRVLASEGLTQSRGDLDEQTTTSLGVAPVAVGASVHRWRQEATEQKTVCRMDLDAVKASLQRAAPGRDESVCHIHDVCLAHLVRKPARVVDLGDHPGTSGMGHLSEAPESRYVIRSADAGLPPAAPPIFAYVHMSGYDQSHTPACQGLVNGEYFILQHTLVRRP